MNTKTKTHLNQTLTSVMPNGKPVKEDGIVYRLVDPTSLAWDALKSLDAETEEDFSQEVIVESNDPRDGSIQDREVYVARFTRHASWGLKAELETEKHGKFALWLEFAHDAE
jgi:hypothetical protein